MAVSRGRTARSLPRPLGRRPERRGVRCAFPCRRFRLVKRPNPPQCPITVNHEHFPRQCAAGARYPGQTQRDVGPKSECADNPRALPRARRGSVSRAVLITGARAPVAVDLGRSFAAAGYDVHFGDSVTPWAARLSNTATAIHRLPPPRTEFAAFARELSALVGRIDPVAIIPTCEEIFYLGDTGPPNVLAPPTPVLRKLHSKVNFAHHVAALGLLAPETWRVTTQAGVDALLHPPRELVFKPEFSRFTTATHIRPAHAPEIKGAWAAQEFIAGEEICVWSFARDGENVTAVTYRPRRRN